MAEPQTCTDEHTGILSLRIFNFHFVQLLASDKYSQTNRAQLILISRFFAEHLGACFNYTPD